MVRCKTGQEAARPLHDARIAVAVAAKIKIHSTNETRLLWPTGDSRLDAIQQGIQAIKAGVASTQRNVAALLEKKNLKYFHLEARLYHDWSLKDVFLLPCVNPHRRSSSVSESISNGLSIFDHHLSRFAKFTPKWNRNDTEVRDSGVLEQIKVAHYIVEELNEAERNRYFPVRLKR